MCTNDSTDTMSDATQTERQVLPTIPAQKGEVTEGATHVPQQANDLASFIQSTSRPEVIDLLPSGSSPENVFFDRIRSQDSPKILEIGSRRVVTSLDNSRFGPTADYTGLDIMEGPNVDVVGDIHYLSELFAPESFDAVLSSAVFEHVALPWKAAIEINSILKPGGLAYLATHHSFPIHELPWDFWRYGFDAFPTVFGPELGFHLLDRSLRWSTRAFRVGSQTPFNPASQHYLFTDVYVQKVHSITHGEAQWDLDYRSLLPARHFYPRGTYQLRDDQLAYRGEQDLVAPTVVDEREMLENFLDRHLIGAHSRVLILYSERSSSLGGTEIESLRKRLGAEAIPFRGVFDQKRLISVASEVEEEGYNAVLAVDLLSHVEHPWLAAPSIASLAKQGGGVFAREMTTCGYRPGQPDLWRFTSEALRIVYHAGLGLVHIDGGFSGALSLVPDRINDTDPYIPMNPTYEYALASFVKASSPRETAFTWPQKSFFVVDPLTGDLVT